MLFLIKMHHFGIMKLNLHQMNLAKHITKNLQKTVMNILFSLIEMKIEEQEASFLINFSIKMLKPAYFCQKKSLNLILILMKKLFCVTEIQNFLKMTKIFNYIEGVDMLNSIFCLIGALSLGSSRMEGQNQYQPPFRLW